MAFCSSVDIDAHSKEELEKIISNHDEAFLYISQGLSYQEQQQYNLARDMYSKGAEKIKVALNVRCDRPYCVGPKWEKARKMQQKMRKTLQVVNDQLENATQGLNIIDLAPPSYDEASGTNYFGEHRRSSLPDNISSHTSSTNGEQSHQNLHSLVSGSSSTANGTTDDIISEVVDLFSIPDGVQLFFISGQDSVTTSSATSSLHVYKFVDYCPNGAKVAANELPSGWLQVGGWTYPLVPGQSPALESGYGAFLFPDISSKTDAAAVAVIFPSHVDMETRRRFKSILDEFAAFKQESSSVSEVSEVKTSTEPESFSDTLSRGIVTGAEYLSAGLARGASFTGQYIHKGASMLKDRLHPESRPMHVDPNVQKGLMIAKGASSVALKTTGFLAEKLGELTMALGNKLAPHIREQGARFLTSAFDKNPQDAKQTMDNVLKVAAGGFQGISTIYLGLHEAARTLASSLGTETVSVINYKYGSEAGEAVDNSVSAIGNLALTAHNIRAFKVKSIAKRTAKDAGKAVLQDYSEQAYTNGDASK